MTEGLLPHDDMESLGVSWFNNWTLAAARCCKSITAYRDTEALFGRDGDNSGLDYNGDVHDEDHDQFSQEFQLASQGNEHLELDRGPVLLPRGNRATARGSSPPTGCSTRCRRSSRSWT